MYISEDDLKTIIESRDIIEQNIDQDPLKLALKGLDSALCSQIKYLNRCRQKLPTYYHNRCIIPPMSYEQCSSELSILSRDYQGERCLDLTCGLGVDSYALSKGFRSVLSIERDEQLAKVARHNFELLKAHNIEVVCADSQEYVSNYSGEKFDMVFIDPARRDSNERFFSFERSSPNVIEMLPKLKSIARRIVIKSSPLFDNAEARRVFGEDVSLTTVSVGGECKELIIEISQQQKGEHVCVIDKNGSIARHSFSNQEYPSSALALQRLEHYKYALIPDASIVKCRKTDQLLSELLAPDALWYSNGSLALCTIPLTSPLVRCYEIKQAMSYKPKQIKSYLKNSNIKSITILTREFPLPVERLRKELSVRDGSDSAAIFAVLGGERTVLFI